MTDLEITIKFLNVEERIEVLQALIKKIYDLFPIA